MFSLFIFIIYILSLFQTLGAHCVNVEASFVVFLRALEIDMTLHYMSGLNEIVRYVSGAEDTVN